MIGQKNAMTHFESAARSHLRHIEFMFFTDKHGAGVHLMECDCSVKHGNHLSVSDCPSLHLTWQARLCIGFFVINCSFLERGWLISDAGRCGKE